MPKGYYTTATRRNWTPEEQDALIDMIERGLPIEVIAERIGRSRAAIHVRAGRTVSRRKARPLSARAFAQRLGIDGEAVVGSVRRDVARGAGAVAVRSAVRVRADRHRLDGHHPGGVAAAVSHLEDTFAAQLDSFSLPYEREVRVVPGRRWRVDFLVAKRIVVEIEGGIWLPGGGRHNRAKGMVMDMDKYNALTAAGYDVLRFAPQHVNDWSAAEMVRRLVEA